MLLLVEILGLLDVLMRVPPLLIIDGLLKIRMGLPNTKQSISSAADYFDDPQLNIPITAGKFLLCLLGFFGAACTFVLWTEYLVIVYIFLISIALIFSSYWINISALSLIEEEGFSFLLHDILSLDINRLLNIHGAVFSILPYIIAQWFVQYTFVHIHLGPRNAYVQKILPFCFMMPLMLAALPFPVNKLKHTPTLAAVLPFTLITTLLLCNLMNVGKRIYNGFMRARLFATNYGLSTLIEDEWERLNVPCVLRAFWIIRLGDQACNLINKSEGTLNVLPTVQKLLVSGCETITAILGMTSIISIICQYIGKLFIFCLMSNDYDECKPIGTVSAILFCILALQTGLTYLSPEKRFIRLCRNLCLLGAALLHFLHNVLSPILMSLSSNRNPSIKKHLAALNVCAFLLIAPISLLIFLWINYSPTTWLLAVTAFSVEVIVKLLVSLAIYTLYILDARRQNFWEKLDDYVYYIRAFGNTVEFCFRIFLFFNGAWILIFESGGAIRAFMTCIHAYFNIWCDGRAGWTLFVNRRTAVHKISSLLEATPEQLRAFDDVCAICYQEMSSAKVTRCKHFFHGICLRKWLYMKDCCPLCHEIINFYKPPNINNNSYQQKFDNDQHDGAVLKDDVNEIPQTKNSAAAVITPNAVPTSSIT